MKILFTICGRAGSKGIKNKNLRTFCGKPLAYLTVSVIDLYLKKHPEVKAQIVVNSDSKELLRLVEDNGLITIDTIERDASLAGDVIGKIAVIKDCLDKMEKKYQTSYDVVVDLDITSPLRTLADLEAVINKHKETGADVTSTVAPARRNPYFNQVKKTNHGFKKVIESEYTARQQAPEIFDMNASIYAYSPAYLKTGGGMLDGYREMVEMYDTAVLDLDHENDFELMEVIAKHLFETKPEFREVYENAPCLRVDSQTSFLKLFEKFKQLINMHNPALSHAPLTSIPFTTYLFSDCIKKDIETILTLKEAENTPNRYAEGIIRNICEQTIEFIYLQHNPSLLGEYYGMQITEEELTLLKSNSNPFHVFRRLIGNKKYNSDQHIRDMAVFIGEEVGTDDRMSLYEAYLFISTHNSYIEDFMKLYNAVESLMMGMAPEPDLDFMILITILTKFMCAYREVIDKDYSETVEGKTVEGEDEGETDEGKKQGG